MTELRPLGRQRGAITIFISMMMLIVVTAMVATAFSLSTTNLQAVGNVQTRSEAIAAAKVEIEKVISSPFTDDPSLSANTSLGVDLNNDDVDDYFVAIAEPVCEQAVQANVTTTSSVQLLGFSAGGAFNTIWRVSATATEASSGAAVTVTQRVRVLLNTVDKEAVCS